MNGLQKNAELQSQAGIHQETSEYSLISYISLITKFSDTMLMEQLEHMGVMKEDCVCQKIVFSEQFFLGASLIFIFTMLGILVILYFWGEVFFVRVRTQHSSRSSVQNAPLNNDDPHCSAT